MYLLLEAPVPMKVVASEICQVPATMERLIMIKYLLFRAYDTVMYIAVADCWGALHGVTVTSSVPVLLSKTTSSLLVSGRQRPSISLLATLSACGC